jgi:glyoxalase family protein
VDFYTQALGMRLVKQTVNFDDPSVYHLYFGDETGSPGTLITFFPYEHARDGHNGAGGVSEIRFGVPEGTITDWHRKLVDLGIMTARTGRDGADRVSFTDTDGLPLAIEEVASARLGASGLTRFSGLEMTVRTAEPSLALLRDTFGMTVAGGKSGRYQIAHPDGQQSFEIVERPDAEPTRMGAGVTHHIAWRVPDTEAQLAWRKKIIEAGLNVTEVQERVYFRSIYFREPGGVLYEIATDAPGMLIDESVAELGFALQLPPWLEPSRDDIASVLTPLNTGAPVLEGVS